MNIKKFYTFILLSLPLLASAQSTAPGPDRSYFADFASEKAVLIMRDSSGSESRVTVQKIEVANSIPTLTLQTADGGEIQLPITGDSMRLYFAYDANNTRRAKDASMDGNYDTAIGYMRKDVYLSLPLLVVPEVNLPSIHSNVINFLDFLVQANRIEEANAIFSSLNYAQLKPQFTLIALNFVETLNENSRFDDAIKLLSKLDFSGEKVILIPSLMDILDTLRNNGKIKEVNNWYIKLQKMPDNPLKDKATLWAIYCDIAMGNLVSARVYAASLEQADRKSEVFSLSKMIGGMISMAEKNYKDSLDKFSEGVVYGNTTDSWMPELMFNTGLSYKALEKPEVSNVIFKEIELFYPNSIYASRAKAQIVKIPPKDEKADGKSN